MALHLRRCAIRGSTTVCLLALWLLTVAWAAEAPKLPANADKAVDAYDAAVTKIQAEAAKKINGEAVKLKAALEKELTAETKKGNLEGATAIQVRIKEIKVEDVLGNKQEPSINVEKFRNYSESQWKDFPGKIYEVSTEQLITEVEIKEGDTAYILPNPNDRWSAGPGFPMVTYKGSSHATSGMSYMCLLTVLNGQLAQVSPSTPLTKPGVIFLRPNDGNLDDNQGMIRVKIHLQKAAP